MKVHLSTRESQEPPSETLKKRKDGTLENITYHSIPILIFFRQKLSEILSGCKVEISNHSECQLRISFEIVLYC